MVLNNDFIFIHIEYPLFFLLYFRISRSPSKKSSFTNDISTSDKIYYYILRNFGKYFQAWIVRTNQAHYHKVNQNDINV